MNISNKKKLVSAENKLLFPQTRIGFITVCFNRSLIFIVNLK